MLLRNSTQWRYCQRTQGTNEASAEALSAHIQTLIASVLRISLLSLCPGCCAQTATKEKDLQHAEA